MARSHLYSALEASSNVSNAQLQYRFLKWLNGSFRYIFFENVFPVRSAAVAWSQLCDGNTSAVFKIFTAAGRLKHSEFPRERNTGVIVPFARLGLGSREYAFCMRVHFSDSVLPGVCVIIDAIGRLIQAEPEFFAVFFLSHILRSISSSVSCSPGSQMTNESQRSSYRYAECDGVFEECQVHPGVLLHGERSAASRRKGNT